MACHSAHDACRLPTSTSQAHLEDLRGGLQSALRLFPLSPRISTPSDVRDRLTPDRQTLELTDDNMDTTTFAGYEVMVELNVQVGIENRIVLLRCSLTAIQL